MFGPPRSAPSTSGRVAAWMGHANTNVSELVYTHLYAKADHDDEMTALGAFVDQVTATTAISRPAATASLVILLITGTTTTLWVSASSPSEQVPGARCGTRPAEPDPISPAAARIRSPPTTFTQQNTQPLWIKCTSNWRTARIAGN